MTISRDVIAGGSCGGDTNENTNSPTRAWGVCSLRLTKFRKSTVARNALELNPIVKIGVLRQGFGYHSSSFFGSVALEVRRCRVRPSSLITREMATSSELSSPFGHVATCSFVPRFTA